MANSEESNTTAAPQIRREGRYLSAALIAEKVLTEEDKTITIVRHANFVPPSTIELEFLDGRRYSLAIDLLGMPTERINWAILNVSPGGEQIVVKGIKGDLIPIDSETLRYLVDDQFAAKINESLESHQLSRDELAEMADSNPPPAEWYAQPERDLTRESWK